MKRPWYTLDMRITKKQKEGVTQEDLDSKLDLILEHVIDLAKIKPVVKRIAVDVEVLKTDVAALKLGHREMSQDVKDIKHDLNKKADKTEVEALKHQIAKFA